MNSKSFNQGLWPLMLMFTLIVLLTNCKKKDDITTPNNQLSGTWSGVLSSNDPSVGHFVDYTLTINFDNLTGSSSCYGNGQSVGSVKIVSSSTITVDWPLCGFETTTYSFTNGKLAASGSVKAYSDNRNIPTLWSLTKQ